jgi:hypothetical protein
MVVLVEVKSMKNALKKIAAVAVVLSLCLATAACSWAEEQKLRSDLDYALSYVLANGY